MPETCPHLSYRESNDDHEFDRPRAYCTVVDRFVQPMRADVCNARYDLSPAEHCEFYRDHEDVDAEYPARESSGNEGGE